MDLDDSPPEDRAQKARIVRLTGFVTLPIIAFGAWLAFFHPGLMGDPLDSFLGWALIAVSILEIACVYWLAARIEKQEGDDEQAP